MHEWVQIKLADRWEDRESCWPSWTRCNFGSAKGSAPRWSRCVVAAGTVAHVGCIRDRGVVASNRMWTTESRLGIEMNERLE